VQESFVRGAFASVCLSLDRNWKWNTC